MKYHLVLGFCVLVPFCANSAAQGVNNPGYVPRPKPVQANPPYNIAHPAPSAPATNVPTAPANPALHPAPFGTGADFRQRDDERFRQNVEANEREKARNTAQTRSFVQDFGRYGLSAPSPNTAWMREGSDAVLINQQTGEVIARRSGVFKPGMSGALPGTTPPQVP